MPRQKKEKTSETSPLAQIEAYLNQNKNDHYNFETEHVYTVSSGSLLLDIEMKKFLVILLVLFFSNSFSQVENSTRKIDIKPPKTSVNIPPVINKNPNSFTFKKIE